MKGVETSMRKVLEGTKQFVVPAYQRPYAWTTGQWEGLWRPIQAQFKRRVERVPANPYFVGSLVLHQVEGVASEVTRFDVIDGQQRLTTIIALLAALRDHCQSEGSSTRTGQAIDEQILRNKFASSSGALKLLPKSGDEGDLRSIVIDNREGTGRIQLAYAWFRAQLDQLLKEAPGHEPTLLTAILDGLVVVEISASEGDNPHRIFQTLNSTGVGLSEVDKLRSHFFMLLPKGHEVAHKNYWLPMERELPGKDMARFLWVDLASRGGGLEAVRSDGVYAAWQGILQEIEDDEQAIINELTDLRRRSVVFTRAARPQGTSPLDRKLTRLGQWGTNVHQPLTHRVLEQVDSGRLADADAVESLHAIESFLVRRMLVGEPTNNLNRIFTTAVGQIAARGEGLASAASVTGVLSEGAKYWPSDVQLRDEAVGAAFARTQQSTQRYFVLRRIEEYRAVDGHVDWDSAKFSLEHFMPQSLSAKWIEYLAGVGVDDPVFTHGELVHTIGNLTLTSLNSKLSNLPLERKQQIISASKLAINDELAGAESWGPADIIARGKSLVEDAIAIWRGPDESVRNGEAYDWSPVELALASLEGSEWTSVAQLTDLYEDAQDVDVLRYVVDVAPPGCVRVLTSDGLPDVRFPWVAKDLEGYRRILVETGVSASTVDFVAERGSLVAADELLARIGEG